MVKMFDKVIYDDLYKLREEFYPHISEIEFNYKRRSQIIKSFKII